MNEYGALFLLWITICQFPAIAAQVIFEDDFKGDQINAHKWQVGKGEAEIRQDDELIFSRTGIPPAPQYYRQLQKKNGEGNGQGCLLSIPAWPRARDGKVLSLTMDARLSHYAYFTAGFVPDKDYAK